MQKKWLPGAALFVAAAIGVGVGCQSQGTTTSLMRATAPPFIVSGPSPQPSSTTIVLVAGTALPIPAKAGFSGTFTEASGAAAGSTVTLASYAKIPAAAPVPLYARRRSSSAGSSPSVGTPIFVVSQKYSAPMSFLAFPNTTWNIPPSFATSGPFELETIDATSGLLLDTDYPSSTTGDTVSFTGATSTFATITSHTYWWELVTGYPSPAPSGCGYNSVTITVNQSGQSVAEPTLCNFAGTLLISPNNAPSGTSMTVLSNVPARTGLDGPPAPSGTTTGIISVAAELSANNITFSSGFFRLAIHFPSSIPAGTKHLYFTSCTIKESLGFNGCVDAPYVSGPLAVSGQNVSFPGLPASITPLTTGLVASCKKFCPPPTRYYYTASIYY